VRKPKQKKRVSATTFRKTAVAKVQSLLVWVRERPQMYALTPGELDLVLSYLHMVWAMLTEREREYENALTKAGQKARGILSDEERIAPLDRRKPPTKRVLKFWSNVDQELGIVSLRETWWDVKLVRFGGAEFYVRADSRWESQP